MAQTLRPASDISAGSWDDAGSQEDDGILWNSLDEVTHDDDTSYVTGTSGAGSFEVKLSSGNDPQVGTGHTVYLWGMGVGSGGPEKCDVELYESTTLIATIATNWSPGRGAYAETSYTLSEAEANSISDYTDLRVRVIEGSIGSGEEFRVTQIYMEIPDAQLQVNKDLQAVWDINNLVNKDNQLVWDLLNLVNKETQLKWDIFNSVNKDLQAKWDIEVLVNKDIQLVWDMEGVIRKDMQLVWDLLNLVNKDSQLVWDIFNAVNKDSQLKWDIDVLVNKDLQAVWDIEVLVNKDMQLVWDMAGVVNKDIQLVWDILGGGGGGGGKFYDSDDISILF